MPSPPAIPAQLDEIATAKRNPKAVSIMLQSMRSNRQNNGIVVFGKNHTPGIIEEFKKQTRNNINIYVCYLPKYK